jgi:uncharacterized membrane protein
MSENLALAVLTYLHVVALSLWFGGLFGYVFIVWPTIMSEAGEEFPRALLVGIAVRTAPWIYMAMATALLSLAAIWVMGGGAGAVWMAGYCVLLIALVANNVYGTIVAWPRMMFAPERAARKEWQWFRLRMTISLVIGLALHASAIMAT